MRKYFGYIIPLLLLAAIVLPNLCFAQDAILQMDDRAQAMQTTAGLSDLTIGYIVSVVIKVVLSLLGLIFLALIIFAGYRWMTAAGNEEAVAKSKRTLTTAIIGLVIILMAYSLTFFIFKQLPFSGSSNNGQLPEPGSLTPVNNE